MNKRYFSAHGMLILCMGILAVGCGRKRTETARHPNGNLMYEISYRGGMKHGPAIFYYHDGRKEAEYHYANDLLHGRTTRWYFNGNMEYEEYYKENQLDGLSRHYYSTGTLSTEQHYRRGELHGDHTAWWENGTVKIRGGHYRGKYHGTWEYFDFQGIKVGEATFDKGTGVMNAYHHNGRINKEIHYLDNVKHGTETTWDPEGELVSVVRYNLGNILSETKY